MPGYAELQPEVVETHRIEVGSFYWCIEKLKESIVYTKKTFNTHQYMLKKIKKGLLLKERFFS